MKQAFILCSLRRQCSRGHHGKTFFRRYNAQTQGPHTTYFQPPPEPPKPPRRIFRTILFGVTCLGLGAYSNWWLYKSVMSIDMLEVAESQDLLLDAMAAAAQDTAARQVPVMDLARAQEYLELRSAYVASLKAVTHTCQFPSNLPCEDAEHIGEYTFYEDRAKDWSVWSVFDGHAGPRTANVLKEFLPDYLGSGLWEAKCMDRPYSPNDKHVVRTIQRIFTDTDRSIIENAAECVKSNLPAAVAISESAAAFSGSCAIVSLFDPVQSILRVATVGDSRAVLGRWDPSQQKYVAMPLSDDQTGFNEKEIDRIAREHPGETPIDPKTGRVLGIMVSRAFGDARWKWPQELSQLAHEKIWGPTPRPAGMVTTPPYLTAEPEVTETRIRDGKNPDFMIMASDGLWENISSEDAVTCVEQWLSKNKSTDFLSRAQDMANGRLPPRTASQNRGIEEKSRSPDDDDDTYYHSEEGCRKWRVAPKHFINEDENCGVHLIKNALGGNRRDLYLGIMSMQAPASRRMRDDITVHVVFFGPDAKDLEKGKDFVK